MSVSVGVDRECRSVGIAMSRVARLALLLLLKQVDQDWLQALLKSVNFALNSLDLRVHCP